MSESAESLVEGVPVAGDLVCMKCGYNLRTLLSSGVCPECGTGVAASVEWERRCGHFDLRRLERGAWLLAGSFLLTGGTNLLLRHTTWFQTKSPWPALIAVLWLIPHVVSACLLFAGILQLSRSRPGGRKWVRWFCLLYPALTLTPALTWAVYSFISAAGRRDWFEGASIFAIFAVGALQDLWCFAVYMTALAYMLGVARILERRWLAVVSSFILLVAGALELAECVYMVFVTVGYVCALVRFTPPEWYVNWYDAFIRFFNSLTIFTSYMGVGSTLTLFSYWMIVALAAQRERRVQMRLVGG